MTKFKQGTRVGHIKYSGHRAKKIEWGFVVEINNDCVFVHFVDYYGDIVRACRHEDLVWEEKWPLPLN